MKSLDFGVAPACARALGHIYHPEMWTRFIGMAVLVTAIGAAGATQTWASAGLAKAVRIVSPAAGPSTIAALKTAAQLDRPPQGADVDGDGRSDFMNPTGKAERTHDAYGNGGFGSSRDGGERKHEGVDYMSSPGQDVVAPMSGFVTHIGYAYPDDADLRTIEIANPALKYVVKLLYVSPKVAVGQSVAIGQVIGQAQSLQHKYPGGMTNHVHLQIAPQGRAWMNAERFIPAARG